MNNSEKQTHDGGGTEFLSVGSYRVRFILSFLFLALILLGQYYHNAPLGIFILSCLSCLLLGSHIFSNAYKDVKKLRLTFNVCAGAAVICGLLFSFVNLFLPVKNFGGIDNLFALPVLNITIINYVYGIFARQREISKAFLGKMHDFLPKSARAVRGDEESKIFASEIKVGDVLHIKKGESVPIDGFVVKGRTEVDESIITGNAIAAVKGEGENVYAGTVNLAGDIFIEASCVLSQTEIYSVVNTLKNSELKKQLIHNPLDAYAKFFWPPCLLACALYVWYGAYTHGIETLDGYFVTGLFFAALSCPAAFVAAVTLTRHYAARGAHKEGIDLQNIAALKIFKTADQIFLDKTGTVTNGIFEVTNVYPVKSVNKELILQTAVTAEQTLDDTYARAIKAYGETKLIKPAALDSIEIYPGKGIRARSGGDVIYIGNQAWFEEENIKTDGLDRAWANEIVICVARNNDFLGFISLSDTLRPGAVDTVEKLKKSGYEIILLSGDGSRTVSYIAGALGGVTYFSSVLPEAKAAMIRKMQKDDKITVMAGDGFNDILALLDADASIAYSSPHSAHANWVDIVINRKDFSCITALNKIYKRINLNILQNIFLAFLANGLLIVFLWHAGKAPWYSAEVFALFGLFAVILNAVRMMRFKI
ncbi:MAG: HAD-IC family P-type ATPase [Elusimicrobium sp.]|jgi:Cu+-exporting ATPase|nr:HAD-IC family P-type ATPase [Elusimicrobium sp.]